MFRRGPTPNHRPRGRALLALVTLVASFVLTTTVPASAITASSGVIGGFQIEGNETVDDNPLITPLVEGTLDWANQTLASAPNGTLTVITDDTLDSGFTQGSKELKPGAWACGDGGAKPGKADILKAFINPRISADGIFLDLAFIRRTADDDGGRGNVHVNFEFNQGTAVGTCPIVRVAGDLLVTYDFPGGSDLPIIRVYRWAPILPVTDDADGDWVEATLLASEVAAAVNAGDIPDPVGGLGTLGPQQFGEVSLDLTRILGGRTSCVSFGSANVRSRSSGESWTSSLQDKLPSTPIDFSTCGQIDLVKKSDSGALLAGAKFQLYKSTDATLTDDEKVGAVCTTPASGVCSWDELLPSPPSYYVVETEAPAGYSLDDDPVVGPINLVSRGSVHINGLTDVDGNNVLDGFSNYKWRYLLNLGPDASNLVNTDHVFTATLQVQKTAAGAPEPAAGKTLALLLTGQGAITPAATTCLTDVAGQCTITIRSTTAGDSTLSVSYDGNVTTIGVDADDSAVKHWINYDIDIAPDATNLVGTSHTFTVTVRRDSGSGLAALAGAHPLVTIVSGPGTFSDNTCAAIAGTNASGQCTINLTSAVTGTTVVKAAYDATEETTSNTFSETATKNWVNYDLTVNSDGINHAGDNHVFTVTLKWDTGSGLVALAGANVGLAWSGTTGAITLVSPTGLTPLNSCTTNASGQCAVTVSSATTGSGTLTANWGILLGSGQLNKTGTANKTWIDWDITIGPLDKTNLVGTDHQFTVTVRYDAGGGLGLQPLAGVKPTITLGPGSVGTVKDTNNPNDCNDQGTSALGTCTVTITSAVTGDSTVTATYNAVHATASNAFENLTATAVKHWVDYKVLVESDAVNTVGDDHVFTVTVTRDIGGEGGFDPLAGADVQLAWSGGAGSGITAVSPAGDTLLTSCSTDEAGQCRVTVSSSSTLSGDLTATYLTVLDSGTHSFSSDANKTWVNWALSITPAQAENLVGTNHTFVVTVTHDVGDGGGLLPLAGAKPVTNLAGLGTVTANTCTVGTNAAGICTVTITSAQPGTSTVSAAYEAAVDQASISLAAQGSKLWVDYRLVVSPKTAVNPVNTTHTFTVTLEKNIGNGWVPAGSEAVTLGLSGPGSITIVDAGLIGSGLIATCTTDAAGTCRVTITSPVAGLATLEASYGAVVGATSRTFTDDGDKLWEAPVQILGVAAETPLQVLAAPVLPAPVLPAELPRTGSPIQAMLYAALMLVGVGFVLRVAGRRRQQLDPPSI